MEHRMKGRDRFTDGLILATIDLTAILSMQNVPSQESNHQHNPQETCLEQFALVTVIASGFKAQRCQENHRSTA